MFWLHKLSVDVLRKVRSSINKIVIGKEKDRYHPKKDAFFDILSLADQLYTLKSTYPEGPEQKKIYFTENQLLDLIKLKLDHLPKAVKAYKEAVKKNLVDVGEKTLISSNIGGNKTVEELSRQVREDGIITSKLYNEWIIFGLIFILFWYLF